MTHYLKIILLLLSSNLLMAQHDDNLSKEDFISKIEKMNLEYNYLTHKKIKNTSTKDFYELDQKNDSIFYAIVYKTKRNSFGPKQKNNKIKTLSENYNGITQKKELITNNQIPKEQLKSNKSNLKQVNNNSNTLKKANDPVKLQSKKITSKWRTNITVDSQQKLNIESGFYIVNEGETLYRVSVNTKVSIEKLKQLNNLKNNNIYPGTKLKIR